MQSILKVAVVCALAFSPALMGQAPGQRPPTPAPPAAPAAERQVITGANTRLGNAGVETLRIRYEAGSRTFWHTHEFAQIVFVEEGVGRFQERGGKIVEVKAGRTYYMKPKTEHWHGASVKEHATLLQVYPQGVHITMLAPVTDAEYGGPAVTIP